MSKKSSFISKSVVFASFILLVLSFQLLGVFSYGLVLDGKVNELEWSLLLKDDGQKPHFSVYWYNDTDKVYLSIVTEEITNDDVVLKFAFVADEFDYWIKVDSNNLIKYRKSGGDWEGYWQKSNEGLPKGLNISIGLTNQSRSYEISIEKTLLGNKASKYPEKFIFWIMLIEGSSYGSVNYYPDSRSGWWFELKNSRETSDSEEERPMVWTSDTEDNPKDRFLVGETVRIKAYSSETPYTIEVWTSIDEGVTWSHVKDIHAITKEYVDDHVDISKGPKGRLYELRLYHKTIQYATSTHFVIPEYLYGSILATVASFIALIALVYRKNTPR